MAILAINGGPKTINHTLGKSWPIFGKEEESALLSILHSGQWYRRGALPDSSVTQFEDAFAAYQNAKHCVAVCTGTQALEVALLASGVQPGDEVIVPAASFIAVAPIVRHPKVTAWGFYFLNLRFNSQEFDGITRDRFVEAIQAEGLSTALDHSRPIYTHEVFQQHPDCLPRGHAARDYDYSTPLGGLLNK